MVYITRKEHFSSSHKLENPNLSKERNVEIFGKCNSFHGHNYYIEVTLSGEPDKDSGYLMNLKLLKKILLEEVVDKVDHKFLNELNMFKGIIPTTENMAEVFWKILKPKIEEVSTIAKLYSIRLYETDKNWVEYRG